MIFVKNVITDLWKVMALEATNEFPMHISSILQKLLFIVWIYATLKKK
jgi:hypothetical protein